MNKNLIIGGVIVLVIALIGGGFFFLNNRNNQQAEEQEEVSEFEEEYPELDPSDIGLEMEARSDNRAVRFIITKASDIESIEYDLSYEADLSGAEAAEGGEGRIQRGVTGEDTISGSKYTSKYLDLGSCSSGKCRYDTGVTEVTLILKITKDDGSIYQVTDTLEL